MEKHEQEEARSLMREVLQDDLLELTITAYKLSDDLESHRCEIYLSVLDSRTGETLALEGAGVGIVDAAWQAFKGRFGPEFPSIESLKFSRFEANGIIGSGHDANADAEAAVQIGITNSYGIEFDFDAQSRSLGHACVQVVAQAIQYFVNSELAIVRMYKARQHYQADGRDDLVTKYTALMAKMVKNTSYSEVLDKIKDEIG